MKMFEKFRKKDKKEGRKPVSYKLLMNEGVAYPTGQKYRLIVEKNIANRNNINVLCMAKYKDLVYDTAKKVEGVYQISSYVSGSFSLWVSELFDIDEVLRELYVRIATEIDIAEKKGIEGKP